MYTLDNYDNTEAKDIQPFENPPSGGYVFKVVEVGTDPARNGRPMVTIKLDIAEGPYAGSFARFPKAVRQMMDKESLPYLKAMINHFAASNPREKMDRVIFKNRDGSTGFEPNALMGLRVGGNLGEAEYIKQETNEIKIGTEVRFLGPAGEILKMKPLPLKKLDKGAGRPAAAATSGRPHGAPAAEDDGLPF